MAQANALLSTSPAGSRDCGGRLQLWGACNSLRNGIMGEPSRNSKIYRSYMHSAKIILSPYTKYQNITQFHHSKCTHHTDTRGCVFFCIFCPNGNALWLCKPPHDALSNDRFAPSLRAALTLQAPKREGRQRSAHEKAANEASDSSSSERSGSCAPIGSWALSMG